MRLFILSIIMLALIPLYASAVTLEQVISREHPDFNCADSVLSVGHDGMVYVANGGRPDGYVLRLGRDGSNKVGGQIQYATHNVAANADGVIADATGHFQHSVQLYDKSFSQTALCTDFLVSDAVGWDAPRHVEVGASNDFYGLDQHRQRILRVNPTTGKVIAAYPLPKLTEKEHDVWDFRVCEKTQALYVWPYTEGYRCIGFDGKTRFTPQMPNMATWDVDDNGVIYWIEHRGDTLNRIDADGKPAGSLKLQIGDLKPRGNEDWTSLRVYGNEMLLKRNDASELFQRYDLTTGKLTNAVSIDSEKLTVTYPSDTWTAGQAIPFTINFDAGPRTITPHWRVWASPLGCSEYREFPVKDGQLMVPADGAGIYQVKVTPEVQPIQTGAASEYLVRGAVEIRPPGAKGSVSVLTPDNRVYYGRGEAIPFSVIARVTTDADMPASVKVSLTDTTLTLAQSEVKITGKEVKQEIPAAFTAGLAPGKYLLTLEAPGFTCVPQPITIGPGMHSQPFQFVQFGDYGATYPQVGIERGYWEGADAAAAHVELTRKLGIDMVADRIGSPLQIGDLLGDGRIRGVGEAIAKRLEADPLATAPGKARTPSVLLQTMAGYDAAGINEMAIPLGMDAGLPLGSGFDARKPADMCKNITTVTQALLPYSSFRGWVWSANWWNFGGLKDDAVDEQQKAAYLAAVKNAKDTGAWDPVLDTVSDRRYSFGVDAQKLFTDTLKAAGGANLVTANSAPYRKVEAYPPVTLSNVDEVDLHIQWEQVAPPYVPPHNVDFYKRPGKRAWGHPELWNDAGTGDQALPNLFDMIMRGADGVGFSGQPHPWGIKPEDSRLSDHGYFSIWRALSTVTKQYGPWFTTLQNNDKVAIIADGRQFRIDEWKSVTGRHFARLWEAYTTCLYAHTPASIIFTDDLKPGALAKYKAVLLVDQWVAMEPALTQALQQAKAAGTAIFYDDTCRAELMAGFTPLGVKFDKFENDPSQAGDDSAYFRFQGYVRQDLPAVSKALTAAAPPPAGVDIDEVFLTERNNGDGKVLFVVNNTLPALDPGQLWRVSLGMTSRVPLVAQVKLPADAKYVYDVFAMKQVTPKDGVVEADLRSMPARVYAVLPAAIGSIKLQCKNTVKPGETLDWKVNVKDENGLPINANIPIQIRLSTYTHEVFDIQNVVTTVKQGVSGTVTIPVNLKFPNQPIIYIEAIDMLSGKRNLQAPVVLSGRYPMGDLVIGTPGIKSCDTYFGPHIRDMAISSDGSMVLLNTNNWDQNLYAVDTASGQTKWRGRVGHYFAFAPQAARDGFAVQGFDFNSAEGYHLYLMGKDGKLERRFALYGLPKRLIQRFVPAILKDRINNFAVPADGSWVASAGDLGLAVWARDGKLLWRQEWWKKERHTGTLAALNTTTLLVAEGLKVTAYNANDGKQAWQQTLAPTGEVREIHVSKDGHTVALQSTTEGGRSYVLRDGKLLTTLITDAGTMDISADGSLIAITENNLLKLYSVTNGLQWTFACDTTARCPLIAPDGKRVVASSDIGSLYVLDIDGRIRLERDLGAVAALCWLPNCDLLIGTWEGKVCRLDKSNFIGWTTVLQPTATDMRDKLLADDGAPTVRIADWSNADPQPKPIAPNLLADNKVMIRFVPSGNWGGAIDLQQDSATLHDGKADPPAKPWLGWNHVNQFAETSPFNYLLLDFFNMRVKATAITLFEDPAHPESWLRDATLEYWDVAKEQWLPVMSLLSNAAVHTHAFPTPIEAARFRIVMPWGLVGNLRLGEIVLHGEAESCSHPDVIAKKPLAVLFDENEDDMKNLAYPGSPAHFLLAGAYTGGRCLAIDGDKQVAPIWRPPFGHVIPNWKFDITEHPEPGQYRWLQFAWKALDAKTTGITLRFGLLAFCAGKPTNIMTVNPKKVADTPPTAWTTVRVDLWDLLKHPTIIEMMALGAEGGPAAFDQVVLGRTEADLPAMTK